MSLGSLSLSSGTKSTGLTAATAASHYSPEAVEILNTAGLLTRWSPVRDPTADICLYPDRAELPAEDDTA